MSDNKIEYEAINAHKWDENKNNDYDAEWDDDDDNGDDEEEGDDDEIVFTSTDSSTSWSPRI